MRESGESVPGETSSWQRRGPGDGQIVKSGGNSSLSLLCSACHQEAGGRFPSTANLWIQVTTTHEDGGAWKVTVLQSSVACGTATDDDCVVCAVCGFGARVASDCCLPAVCDDSALMCRDAAHLHPIPKQQRSSLTCRSTACVVSLTQFHWSHVPILLIFSPPFLPARLIKWHPPADIDDVRQRITTRHKNNDIRFGCHLLQTTAFRTSDFCFNK